MVKNQAKAKQHPETGLFLNFQNYSLSSALCNPKIVEDILKKNKCVCFNEIKLKWVWLWKMHHIDVM